MNENLPPIRPRGPIGILAKNGEVLPSAPFLRWLENFKTTFETTIINIESGQVGFSVPTNYTELAVGEALTSYPEKSEDQPMTFYPVGGTEVAFTNY